MAFASRSLRVTCLALLVALCGACRQRPPTPPSKPPVDPGGPNAATGFDNLSNGVVTDATHREDLAAFDDVEQIADGLGPLYNAQSCRECHQHPVSGGPSQVTELRVGHNGPGGRFVNPDIPIGPNNRIEPGGPDMGQPTHFLPGRQYGMFSIPVPREFKPTDTTSPLQQGI